MKLIVKEHKMKISRMWTGKQNNPANCDIIGQNKGSCIFYAQGRVFKYYYVSEAKHALIVGEKCTFTRQTLKQSCLRGQNGLWSLYHDSAAIVCEKP